MDSQQIVLLAVSALAQLFSNAAEGASKKLGEKTGERVYALLQKKFKRSSYEAQTLERFRSFPSLERQKALIGVLEEVITTDLDLLESLVAIFQQEQSRKQLLSIVSQKADNIEGNVYQIAGEVIQINSRDEK